jgi:1-acyl-sn-glycerol-3-phosphate acyltransferase
MLFIRSVFLIIGTTISLVLIVSISLLLAPFLNVRQWYGILSKWAVFCTFWIKITNNIESKVIGLENIPNTPCVIAPNHQSTFETIFLLTIFPHQTWVLKRELLKIPFFGWGVSILNPIIINRKEKIKSIKKIIEQGADRIKNGIFVVIFPEGTRQPYKKLGKYHNGAAEVAKKSGCDIIPVYHNAGKLWPKGQFVKKSGNITVVIGKPISTEGMPTSQITKLIKEWAKEQEVKIDG